MASNLQGNAVRDALIWLAALGVVAMIAFPVYKELKARWAPEPVPVVHDRVKGTSHELVARAYERDADELQAQIDRAHAKKDSYETRRKRKEIEELRARAAALRNEPY